MIQDSDLDSFLRSDTGSDEPAAAPKTGSAPPSAGSFTFNLKAITPEISQAFKVAADVYGVDENVLIGIAARESGFNPQAIGPVTKKGKRAVGLMMFMPDTAKEYGIDPTDPIESVMAAAAYMRQSLDRFGGDYRKSIASYNWGRDRSEFDSPDWDKSLPKETSQYLAYVEQFIGADGEPAKGDSFGTARTEDRGFVPDVQDTSEMEAASKPYFGTSSPKSRRPQEESLSPTVVGPSAPEDLPTTSKAPVDPKVRAEIYAAWDAADPGKRAMMEAAPGWAGMLARERAGVFKRFDAGKTGVVEQFDPRREARSNRLVGAGENAIFADRAAKEAAASGIDPGNEVKFIQGQYGTIGTNRSPIGQMQDELAATRPGAKPEGVVEVASNAIMRGIHQNAGMGSALLAAGAKSIGADGLALDLLRSYFLRQIDAKKYPAQIEDFTKIDSLSDVPVYVLEGVLENAPQLVGTIGSSVIGATLAKKFGAKAVADMAVEQAGKELARRQAIGAAVGAGATSIGMETGSIYGDVAKDTGQERPGVAASFGVVAGALDAIPAFRAATKILGQDTSSFVAKEIFKRYGTEAVKQLRSEGGTEFLQTWIEEAAKTYVDGRPLLTAENLIQAIDAGLKGGPAGAVTGASSQGISDFRNRALIAVDDAAKKAKSDALNKWQSFADAGKRAPQERNAEAKIADISKAETIDEVAAKALEVVNTPVASAASVTTAPDLAPTVDAITALENTNVSPSGDSGVVAAGAPASQADQSGPGVGAAGLAVPDSGGSGSVDTATADSSVPASGAVPQPGGESSPAVEPAKVWYGRRGDGYLTPEDAQRGLGERQRLQGQFDWRIEPTPDGKYRLAGYAPSTATGTVQASAPAYQSVNQSPITFRQGKGGSWFVGGDPATIRDLLRANGITNFLPTKDGAQLPANTDPEVIGAIRMMAEDFKNLSIQELKNEIRQRMGMTKPPKEPKQTRPFRDFLRSVGIRSDIAGDVVGESNRMRANQILPMTFRRNGLNLDALAERALEMGFLTQQDIDNPNDNGGVNRLVEMIKAESRGVRQAPIDEQTSVDAEQAQAEKELIAGLDKLGVPASSYADLSVPQMNSMLNRIERRLRDARLRKQQLDVAEESRLEREAIQMADQITLADVSALERRSEMREASLEQFMRALLFTEQEIQDELAKQANQAQSDQAPAGDAATGPQGSAEADAGNTDRASQAGPAGEVDLFGAAPNASQQEANRIRQEREDRERAQQQSAPSPDEFSLSGSDRAADVGAARGQGDLLAPSATKDAQQAEVPALTGIRGLDQQGAASERARKAREAGTSWAVGIPGKLPEYEAPTRASAEAFITPSMRKLGFVAYPMAQAAPSEPMQEGKAEPSQDNDRDSFTLERLNRETNEMESITFRRGEYVTFKVGEGGRQAFGDIDGISHARREFSVDGLWYDFGFAYKAQRPEPAKKDTVPMSKVVDAVNKKNGSGLGPADAVSIFEAFKATMRAVYDGTASIDDYKTAYSKVRDAEKTKAELGKLTKDELVRTFGIMAGTSEKKDSLVATAYKAMLRGFALGKQYGSNSYLMTRGGLENYERQQAEALDAIVQNHTADDLAAFAAEVKAEREAEAAKRAAAVEAIKNPKTLDEYRRFMSYHTRGGKSTTEVRLTMLTPEQRSEFDLMLAEEARGRRKASTDNERTQVRVAGQTVDGNIIATKHTKKGHDLFVVQLSERVSREDYETLNTGAKKIGGYYSSFRGGGAIPGFQFTTREQAQAFVTLAGGDATAAKEAAQERRDAYADDRSQTAAERLTEMANAMEEAADESLSLERKANTARRARFAAAAEAGAREAKAMAKTMRNVAEALTSGKAKFLDRIRTKTQVELLQTYVANAKDAELRAKYPTYAEQEKRKGQPPTQETADYAEFPEYTAFRSDLASLGRQLLEVDGTKKLGERLMKVADDVSEAFTAWAKEPGNLFKLSAFSVRSGDEVKTAIFRDRETAERAIKRSGLSGKAIVFPEKRGVNRIIMSPSEAIARKIWTGDGDKRITLNEAFGAEIVEGIGRAAKRGSRVNDRLNAPWQFERAYERRKQFTRMGIETPAEFRSALREFIGLREQAAEADKIKAMERAMIGRVKDGLDFFPTPEAVADEMLSAAGLQPGMRVLEPSAGMGHIADRIREAGFDPEVGEVSNERRELLEAKGFNVKGRDFMDMAVEPDAPTVTREEIADIESFREAVRGDVLSSVRTALNFFDRGDYAGAALLMDRATRQAEFNEPARAKFGDIVQRIEAAANGGYDRIIMNPPFSDGRDIEHVRHAYTLLKPGGRIVALMGESAFTNQNKRATEFREWLESVGGTEEKLPDGSFMDPSLPVNTGANARMVVIDKPEAGALDAPALSRSGSTPYYSSLRQSIEKINAKALPPGLWKDGIRGLLNKGAVKADEVEWSGLNEWLDLQSGKVTKDQVLAFLDANGVRVEEVTLGGIEAKEGAREAIEAAGYIVEDDGSISRESEDGDYESVNGWDLETRELRDAAALLADAPDGYAGSSGVVAPKYNQYTLPGGTNNYREVLLTLPPKIDTRGWYVRYPDGSLRDVFSSEADAKAKALKVGGTTEPYAYASGKGATQYKSNHWDQPNVIAHLRLNDRTDAQGKRVLFVEEIQSDYAQEARKTGIKGAVNRTPESVTDAERARSKDWFGITDADWARTDADGRTSYALEMLDTQAKKGVPAAPFIDATDKWLTLALKRIMVMAAQEGYDRVAFINGEQSADRYDLSKQVDQVSYGDDGVLRAFQGRKNVLTQKTPPEKIEDYIGKEPAKRLLAAPMEDGRRVIMGESLKVGGEGMRAFYDTIVPNTLKPLLKKVGGGQIVGMRLPGSADYKTLTRAGEATGLTQAQLDRMPFTERKALVDSRLPEQPGFDITPDMRERLVGGMPLFRAQGQTGGMSVEAARRIIDAKVAKWKNGPRVVVVATPQDLPMQAPDDANGVYHQGTVYIVAGAHRSPGQVLRTLAHEAVAHYGLRGMLGDGYKKFLAQMQMAIKMGNKPLNAIRDDVRSRYRDEDGRYNLTELQEADEIAARAIEMGLDENGEFKTGFGWLKSWFAKLAQFLRELGITIPVTNAELQGMLVNAQRFVQGRPDGTGVVVEPAPAFARDGTIDVDGVQRPRTNSKGQPIHPTEEGIKNFWRWFSPSPGQLLDGLSVAEISSLKRDTEALADFIESQSSLPEPDRFSVIPSSVFSHMSGVVDNRKILDAVVRSLPVDVVDFLSGKKLSAKEVLHDSAMLENMLTVDPASDVSLGINPSGVAELLVRVVANAGAKISGLTGGALERNAAVLADANDPVLGAHVRKSSSGDLGVIAGFGDSKVVDDQGRPLVVYHGTGADFSTFDEGRVDQNYGVGDERGFFFTSKPREAEWAADHAADVTQGNANIMPVYLKIQDPTSVDVQQTSEDRGLGDPTSYLDAHKERIMGWAQDDGKDGVIVRNEQRGYGTYVAFRPNQIKSATGNSGAFSNENDDIAFSRGQPGLFDSGQWDVPETGRVDAIIQKFQDGRIDLKRAQDAIIESGKTIDEKFDARLAETLYAGRVAHRSENFIKGEVKELLERMARLNVPMTDLSDFLLARHAPERNKQIAKVNPDMPDGGAGSNSKGELMTTQAAKDYIAALPSETKLKMTTLAALVDKITKGTRELLVAEGLESRDSIQAWEGAYSNYVPLFKDEAQGVSHPIGQGMSVRGSASRRATGSTGEVTNMLAHVLMQREAAITRAEKNRVGLALYGLALSHPNKDFWTTIKPNMSEEAISEELEAMGVDLNEASQGMSYAPTIRDVDSKTGQVVSRPNPLYKNLPGAMVVRVNGEDRVLMFNQQNERGLRLAQNLKNLDGLDIANETLQKIVGTPTRWIASVNTQYNPAFGLVNVTRDALGAMVNLSSTQIAGKQLQVAGHVPSAMAGIFQHMRGDMDGEWAKLYEQFQMDGGKTGFKEMFRTADERTKALQDAIDKVDRSKLDPREIAGGLLSILDGFNTISENIVRLSAYKVALDSGLSRAESARLARELTVDFNRKGSHGTTMGMLYAFFNASVQGSARTIKAIQGPAGKSIILGGLALGAMQALMLAAAGYDDDEIPEWVKARGLVIPLGKDDQGQKKHAIIPLPLGLHVLPNTGRALTELALYGKRDMGTKIVNAVGEIAGAFNPMGGANILTDEGALKTILPTIFDPLAELATNTNFSGRKIEKDYRETDNRPGFQRAREGTIRTASGQAYISVSKAMNTLTGGTDYQRGLASPSPEQIRYVAQVVGGGLLREVEKVANMAMPTASQRDIKVTGIPLAGRFYGVADDEQTQSSRYYKNAKDIDKIESSLGAAKKAGDREAVAEMSKDPLAALVHYNNTVGARLSKLNKMAVQTVNDRARTIRIDRDRTELMRSLNNEVIRMEEKADGPNLAQRMRR